MALADFISLPLRILWSVSGFVLSHGWALVFTVAATIALAVIIHHRMKPSSRQGRRSPSINIQPAVVLSELLKAAQLHPKFDWSLKEVVEGFRVFSRFFPVLCSSTRSSSPVLAIATILDKSPKRAHQILINCSELPCWMAGIRTPAVVKKPQGGSMKGPKVSDNDVIEFQISTAQSGLMRRALKWFGGYLPVFKSVLDQPECFSTVTIERSWQCQAEGYSSLVMIPSSFSSSSSDQVIPSYWSLILLSSVPKQKDMSLATLFFLPKLSSTDSAIQSSISQLSALRDHILLKELRVYSGASTSEKPPSDNLPLEPMAISSKPEQPAKEETEEESTTLPPEHPSPSQEPVVSETDRFIMNLAKKCARKLKRIADATVEDNWVILGTNKNVTVMKKLPEKGEAPVNCIKGTTTVLAPPDFILHLLISGSFVAELDSMLKEMRDIHTVSPWIHLRHLTYKAVWPTTSRDFACLDVAGRLSSTVRVHAAMSITDSRIPEDKNCVRGEVLAGGYVICNVPGDPNKSLLTYVTQVDLKGNVPAWVVNKVTESQPLCAAEMRRIAENEYALAIRDPNKMRQWVENYPIYDIFPREESKPTTVRPLEPPTASLPQPPLMSNGGSSSSIEDFSNLDSGNRNDTASANTQTELTQDKSDLPPTPAISSLTSDIIGDPPINSTPTSSSSSTNLCNNEEGLGDGLETPSFFSPSSPSLSNVLSKIPRYSSESSNGDDPGPLTSISQTSMNYPRRENDIDYRTLANQSSAKILEEMFHISSVKLYDSSTYTDQGNGWRFQGIEKNVLIFKRKVPDSPYFGFIGKGLIDLPPQQVFDHVRNPNQRFIFDNMLKELHIVKQIEEGLYILHLHHETTQCFLKQSRDFCILACERSEPNKKILVGSSIEVPECPPQENITRGKIFSSGWVIEPYQRKGQLCTEVTYIVQMDVGGVPATLVNFISQRQPLAVAYLRDYMESTTIDTYSSTPSLEQHQEEEYAANSASWTPNLFRRF